MRKKLERLKRSATHAAVGGIAGYIVERGLESATGMEFIDGVFEIAGATFGAFNANKDLIRHAYDGVLDVTGKEPRDLTNDEWEKVRAKYPKAVEYLERALILE
jgi:hypothetical protein